MSSSSSGIAMCASSALQAAMAVFTFFFSSRRRHTRLQGDWSSDVSSSDLRQHQSSGDSGAHQSDGLVHVNRKSLKTRYPVLVVFNRFETQGVCQLVFRLNAAALIQRH